MEVPVLHVPAPRRRRERRQRHPHPRPPVATAAASVAVFLGRVPVGIIVIFIIIIIIIIIISGGPRIVSFTFFSPISIVFRHSFLNLFRWRRHRWCWRWFLDFHLRRSVAFLQHTHRGLHYDALLRGSGGGGGGGGGGGADGPGLVGSPGGRSAPHEHRLVAGHVPGRELRTALEGRRGGALSGAALCAAAQRLPVLHRHAAVVHAPRQAAAAAFVV